MRELILSVLLAACTDPGLPPAFELARGVEAFTAHGETVYWVGSDFALQRTEPDGSTTRLDAVAPPLEGAATVWAGGNSVVWGHGKGFVGRTHLRTLSATGNDARDLPLESWCCVRPMMVHDRDATTVFRFANEDQDTVPLVEMDLSTLSSVELFPLETQFVSEARLAGERAWVVAHDRGGGFVATFDARTPSYLVVETQGVRAGLGPVVGDGHVYVIENGSDEEPTRIYQVDGTPERVIARLDGPHIAGAAWLDGALWLLRRDIQSSLIRIEPSGSRQDYTLDYEAISIDATEGRLLVLTASKAGASGRLLVQPIP